MRGSVRHIFGRHSYDLRDKFNDDRAAGAVNGTLATDGVNTRTVVDTTAKLTISGGAANLTPGPGWSDPNLQYPSQTRAAGRVLRISVTPASIWLEMMIGWGTAHAFWYGGGGGGAWLMYDGAGNITIGTFTATLQDLAIATRAVGAYYFRAGTLVGISGIGNAALSPRIRNNSGTFTVDEIAVRTTRWLPTPLLSDGFGTAGALVTSDGLGHAEGVTGGLGSGGDGRAWTAQIGTWANAAGVCGATALVGGIAIATAETTKTDVLHSAECTRSAGNVGVVVRYADADNYVYAIHNGVNALLIKRVATAETTLINAAKAYAAGAELRVICDGTSFDLFYNNAKIGTTQTINDAALQTGTAHGLYTSDTGNTFDDAVTHKRSGHDVPS